MSCRIVRVALFAVLATAAGSSAMAQSGKMASFMPSPAHGLSYVNSKTGAVTPVPRRPPGTAYAPTPKSVHPQGTSKGLSYVNMFSNVTVPVPRRPAGFTYAPTPPPKNIYPNGASTGLKYVNIFSDIEIPVPRRPTMQPMGPVAPSNPYRGGAARHH